MGQDIGIVRILEIDYPGRTLAVIPVGYRLNLPPGATLPIHPDYQKFDRALKTPVRPVLVPLERLPFRDFTAEEFGPQVFNCRGPAGCVSMWQGSPLTLGQIADACSTSAEAPTLIRKRSQLDRIPPPNGTVVHKFGPNRAAMLTGKLRVANVPP
jgi:hypothetical protein